VQRGNLKSLSEPRRQQNLSANPKTDSEIIYQANLSGRPSLQYPLLGKN
jgi:hypothetical protein